MRAALGGRCRQEINGRRVPNSYLHDRRGENGPAQTFSRAETKSAARQIPSRNRCRAPTHGSARPRSRRVQAAETAPSAGIVFELARYSRRKPAGRWVTAGNGGRLCPEPARAPVRPFPPHCRHRTRAADPPYGCREPAEPEEAPGVAATRIDRSRRLLSGGAAADASAEPDGFSYGQWRGGGGRPCAPLIMPVYAAASRNEMRRIHDAHEGTRA